MADYSRRNFIRRAFTLASGLAVASVIPGINPLERIAMASDSDDPKLARLMKSIKVGASPEEIQKTIDRINYHREQAFRHYVEKGLLDESVIKIEEDPELTDAANKHAVYLIVNNISGNEDESIYRWHSENQGGIGYTPEGDKMARQSGIGRTTTPLDTVDVHIRSFYHRLGMINPHMRKSGIGYANRGGRSFSLIGFEGLENIPANIPPILYPAPNQQDVPIPFIKGEIPNPLQDDKDGQAGYPITATFYSYPRPNGNPTGFLLDSKKFEEAKTKLTKAKPDLKEGSEEWWDIVRKYAEVKCGFSSPEKPANDIIPSNYDTICLIPDDILKPDNIYTVHMSAPLFWGSGSNRTKVRDWQETWSFKTMSEERLKELEQVKR